MMIGIKCSFCGNICDYDHNNDNEDGDYNCCRCWDAVDPSKYCTNCLADYGSDIADRIKGEMEEKG